MQLDLPRIKLIFDIIASIVTIAAIIIGGIWSFYFFIRKRERFPKILTKHTVSFTDLKNGENLLTLMVELENTGDRLVILTEGEVAIYQVFPLPDEFARLIKDRKHQDNPSEKRYENGVLKRGESGVLWPALKNEPKRWEPGEVEIEPGEVHQVDFNFILSNTVRRVRIYTWFENSAKQKKGLGWTKVTFADVILQDQVIGGKNG